MDGWAADSTALFCKYNLQGNVRLFCGLAGFALCFTQNSKP